MERKDFQALARTRLAEARALLEQGMPEGAYYLAGYAVECALKACIARMTRRHDFPEKQRVDEAYSHDLKKLFKTARLDSIFAEAQKADPGLKQNWEIVKDWNEQSRYNLPKRRTEDEARDLVRAIAERTHGILSWLKSHW